MNKFLLLLEKELRELLTPQVIAPFVIVILAFNFIGTVIGRETDEQAQEEQSIIVIDQDNSTTSQSIISLLETGSLEVEQRPDLSPDDIKNAFRDTDDNLALVIPAGFDAGIQTGQAQSVDLYSEIQGLSFMANMNIAQAEQAFATINETISSALIAENTGQDPQFLKNPVLMNSVAVIGNNEANVSPQMVLQFISGQTVFIPIVLFLVITLASQLIASSIATEKENKTLETLLSTPVDRKAVVAAKLISAGLVSLLFAVAYLWGMQNYMSGLGNISGQMVEQTGQQEVMRQLGLVLTTSDYLLLGITLFLSILTALSIAFILGSFAQDAKSAQSVIAPLMLLLIVPYLLSMFTDISSLSPTLQTFINIIPFTHTFTATPNLLLGNIEPVIFANIYLAGLVIIGTVVAAQIFSSGRILTLQFSLKKK
ncbi:MAG: ABC transporter permease [Candidatus Dojkabacteria bacterium]|nr:ABC transporter permease [Candidatus Dojkabacteria bacterium]